MALVELARFDSKAGADIARMLLEAEGLQPLLFDEAMSHMGLGSIMPVRLMVLEEEYEAAAALLIDEGLL